MKPCKLCKAVSDLYGYLFDPAFNGPDHFTWTSYIFALQTPIWAESTDLGDLSFQVTVALNAWFVSGWASIQGGQPYVRGLLLEILRRHDLAAYYEFCLQNGISVDWL